MTREKMKVLFRTIATIAAVSAILFIYSKPTPAANDSIEPTGNVAVVTEVGESGETNVTFSWKDTDGNIASLENYRGKVVLVNFWATWCVPCRKEIPYLIEINNELDDDVFTVIGISVDTASDINKVDMFIESEDINYTNVLDDGRLTRYFGNIRSIPTTLIIDKNGDVRETIVGIRTKEQFMQKIQQYL